MRYQAVLCSDWRSRGCYALRPSKPLVTHHLPAVQAVLAVQAVALLLDLVQLLDLGHLLADEVVQRGELLVGARVLLAGRLAARLAAAARLVAGQLQSVVQPQAAMPLVVPCRTGARESE